MKFVDRVDAGRQLAERLHGYADQDVVVLGLPRGGVPVAFEVAAALGAPLDVIVVRKLGVPFQPELAMGAIGEEGALVMNEEVLRAAQITPDELARVEAKERRSLLSRVQWIRGDRPRVDLAGRTVIVVDDGIATGSTARAACQVARAQGAAKVVLAAPVAPVETSARFADDADELVVVVTPEPFYAVGQFYLDFSEVSDQDVMRVLAGAPRPTPAPPIVRGGAEDAPRRGEEVAVTAGAVTLMGDLVLPEHPVGVVLFAHGSGSSRHSTRNRYVASVLNGAGIGTLLFDLLTVEEELDRANVFDVELLANRLLGATAWLRSLAQVDGLPIGYFGASTGAAAALWAAADPGARISAVVSRGGRPDLAGPRLGQVTAPTLLIVGGHDHVVLDLNRMAAARLRVEVDLVVIPGATHLFEEPGTLQAAAIAARDWFARHLRAATRPGPVATRERS
jgi:putative phosphoribosyl transferase